jgi:alpha-tubulin suppressor-like RCC1 family protein
LKPVAVLGGLLFKTVGVGYGHSCGLTTNSLAYCWGSNGSGEVGDGTRELRPTPVAVVGGHEFKVVDAGAGYNCGVTTSGRGYCWGDNFFGELGDGNSGVGARSSTPVAVAGPS